MKAIVLSRYGSPDVLRLQEVVKPAPRSDEVLIRAHTASINDWDWGILESGKFVPVIDGPCSLREVPEAFRRFGAGLHKGKVIVSLDRREGPIALE